MVTAKSKPTNKTKNKMKRTFGWLLRSSSEEKDGNPLNEVRMMCNSILQNHGVLSADKTIKFNPAKSISKLQIGDKIKLTESDFVLLFLAFFAEIETKFMQRKSLGGLELIFSFSFVFRFCVWFADND